MSTPFIIYIAEADASLKHALNSFCLPYLPDNVELAYEGALDADAATLDLGMIAKPYRLGALIDGLYAALRKHNDGSTARSIEIGPYSLDVHQNELHLDSSVIKLTDKEVEILIALYDVKGRSIAKQDLLGLVWGYVEGLETHTLETHIYRLRQKIEEDPANPKIVLTLEEGYTLSDL